MQLLTCAVLRFCFIDSLQRAANMIPAHDSPLAALAFDASGTKLATASEKVRELLIALLTVIKIKFVIKYFKCAQFHVQVPGKKAYS